MIPISENYRIPKERPTIESIRNPFEGFGFRKGVWLCELSGILL